MMGVTITGLADVKDTLAKLSSAAKNKIGTAALVEAMTPMVDAARNLASASVDTGNLKASVGFRVKAYRKGAIVGVIGPRNGFKTVDRQGRTRIATKYAHLVEFGHVAPNGMHVAAKPFMRPAFAAKRQQVARDLGVLLGKKIDIEAARLAKRKRKKA